MDLVETIQELRSSGIQFCLQFVGSVVVRQSLNMLSSEQQNEAAISYIRKLVTSSDITLPSTSHIKFVDAEQPKIMNISIDINISSNAIILLDNIEGGILYRFEIRDVSLLSKGKENYFCFFAKVKEKNNELQRKCFVFDAMDEINSVHEIIGLAFTICDLENFETQEKINVDAPPSIKLDSPPIRPPRSSITFTSSSLSSENSLENNSINIIDIETYRPENLTEGRRRSASSSKIKKFFKFLDGSDMIVNMSTESYNKITENLLKQKWFHGLLSRKLAESLILEDGQFLVRFSPNIDKQIVLTGMYGKSIKHICLVGYDGKVYVYLYILI